MQGRKHVGGLVRQNYGQISDSYAAGLVTIFFPNSWTPGAQFGGLVGLNAGPITNSYARGTASAPDRRHLHRSRNRWLGGKQQRWDRMDGPLKLEGTSDLNFLTTKTIKLVFLSFVFCQIEKIRNAGKNDKKPKTENRYR